MPIMRGIGLVTTLAVPGATDNTQFNTSMNLVSAGYFDAMGIRLLSGRDFQKNDESDRQPAPIIVNEAFVRRFFGEQQGIGLQIGRGVDNQPQYEIVGVVNDAHYRSLREVPPPTFYRPVVPNSPATRFVLNVRTNTAAESIIQPLRDILKSIDPAMPIYEVTTLADEIDRSLWQERLTMALGACFGLFAMILSAIGLYGMMAYFVVQQRRELGIRLAIGANAVDVFWVVLYRLMPVMVCGLVAGGGLYFAGGRYLQGIIYGVNVFDPVTIAVALILVVATSIAASAIPFSRAIRMDPAITLREQ
jgi:hypothetical protein